ncbi:hypothetical protein F4804DRAFT_333070 [Jackrogersella minutella]|nr:hypothetical protein F4804DRAFT_333070 [Jackrogersella minutella]
MSDTDEHPSPERDNTSLIRSLAVSDISSSDESTLKRIVQEVVREDLGQIRKSLHFIRRDTQQLNIKLCQSAKDQRKLEQQMEKSVSNMVESIVSKRVENVESAEFGIVARHFELECRDEELEQRRDELGHHGELLHEAHDLHETFKELELANTELEARVFYLRTGVIILVLVGLIWLAGILAPLMPLYLTG